MNSQNFHCRSTITAAAATTITTTTHRPVSARQDVNNLLLPPPPPPPLLLRETRAATMASAENALDQVIQLTSTANYLLKEVERLITTLPERKGSSKRKQAPKKSRKVDNQVVIDSEPNDNRLQSDRHVCDEWCRWGQDNFTARHTNEKQKQKGKKKKKADHNTDEYNSDSTFPTNANAAEPVVIYLD